MSPFSFLFFFLIQLKIFQMVLFVVIKELNSIISFFHAWVQVEIKLVNHDSKVWLEINL